MIVEERLLLVTGFAGTPFSCPCLADPVVDARVFRQAIDAAMQGIKVSDYAEEHEELKTALTKWGTGRTGFQMKEFD